VRAHGGTPEILERLACLTRIRDPEGIELNLLKVLQAVYDPRHILVFALDRQGDVRVVKRYLGGHDVADLSDLQLKEFGWASEASALIQRAVRTREATQTGAVAGTLTLAYPLLFTDPWNVGLALVFEQDTDIPHRATLATLLQIYRNFCALMDESQRDQLTGLLNRKTFDDNIQRVLARAMDHANRRAQNERRRLRDDSGADDEGAESDTGSGNWLAIIDIDHFKRINDTHGHLHGDEVLLLMAQMLRTSFRDTDLIYRFGGEEFVVILTSADGPSSSEAFERFRQTVAARDFPQVGHITISFGATRITEHCNAHILLDKADQALYHAKQNGRNQGHLYDDLASSGLIAPVAQKYGDMEIF
jgi:diguanylate cyclase (GGDEF)-like protein